MKINDLLAAMERSALGAEFRNALQKFYAADIREDAGASMEKDYETATAQLGYRPALAEMESLYAQNRDYAGAFAFRCGMYGAFQQYFSRTGDADGGFQSLLCESLLTEPGMQRHQTYRDRIDCCNALANDIRETLCGGDREHLVSIECAWSERIYSAAVHGFCCGFRGACQIIEGIDPLGKAQIMERLPVMEYHLGIEHRETD